MEVSPLDVFILNLPGQYNIPLVCVHRILLVFTCLLHLMDIRSESEQPTNLLYFTSFHIAETHTVMCGYEPVINQCVV